MQILHVLGHRHALGVTPRAFADAIARVHARVAPRQCRAQVRAPVRVLRAGRLGERKAMRIGALQAAEIGTVALAHARYEERHAGLLSVHAECHEDSYDRDSRKFHRPPLYALHYRGRRRKDATGPASATAQIGVASREGTSPVSAMIVTLLNLARFPSTRASTR